MDWFERHLKQDGAARAKAFPPVRFFSMGDNLWHDAQSWPPEGFTATAFHLRSDGKANTRKGGGRLSREAPIKEEPADSFRADPANPVPACPVTEARPVKAAVWGSIVNANFARSPWWHRSHVAPSCPRWTSVWHDVQVRAVPVKCTVAAKRGGAPLVDATTAVAA
jgi:hypothetical protein